MKKAIVIIQSQNGQNKSSIIRTISQILIGLSETTVVNVGEIGLSENITSIVEIDNLKVGVATQNNRSNNAIEMIQELHKRACDFILCAIGQNSEDTTAISDFAEKHNFQVTNLESYWSEKLEVNYLTESQVGQILEEINRVKSCST